jgi:hypothetical protein
MAVNRMSAKMRQGETQCLKALQKSQSLSSSPRFSAFQAISGTVEEVVAEAVPGVRRGGS